MVLAFITILGKEFELVLRARPSRPSLPPPTFITTAEPAPESRPGLVKATRSNVVPLRRVG